MPSDGLCGLFFVTQADNLGDGVLVDGVRFHYDACAVGDSNRCSEAWLDVLFLHVELTHIDLDDLVNNDPGNPIEEVWLWQPAPATVQFVTSPQVPSGGNNQWMSWKRPRGPASELRRLIANNGYLVYNGSQVNFSWNLKGRPVPPAYRWTSTGLNFIGFPTPESNSPNLDNLFAPVP